MAGNDCNSVALPTAVDVFEPALGLALRPQIAVLSMSGSSFLVAVTALLHGRLRLSGAAKASRVRVPGRVGYSQHPVTRTGDS